MKDRILSTGVALAAGSLVLVAMVIMGYLKLIKGLGL